MIRCLPGVRWRFSAMATRLGSPWQVPGERAADGWTIWRTSSEPGRTWLASSRFITLVSIVISDESYGKRPECKNIISARPELERTVVNHTNFANVVNQLPK